MTGDGALVIGGTGFVGRHTVREFRDHGYDVSVLSRGTIENPFTGSDVDHVRADRTDDSDLANAARAVAPDVVVDCAAYRPRDVRTATRLFDDVDAYVYVSSGAAYGVEEIPKREDETPLAECSDAEATDDSTDSYGQRKAAGDRAVFDAAADGVNASSVRPANVYGPHDDSGYLDYWIDRVERFDRVLLPGDGTTLWHRAYVEDVASALRIVAERGDPGAAYNVADRRATTLRDLVDGLADAVGADPEFVTAGPRELAAGEIGLTDFPLYRDYPHLLATNKLTALGWESTPVDDALAATISEYHDSERDGSDGGPARSAAERVLGVLETL